jgi:glycosyltransferase involved in cell wall biosynthesis
MIIDIPVLIPSYNPDNRLFELVKALIRNDVKYIIIIDDGSIPACETIFKKLEALNECTVLRHAVNYGKGRALKTGLNHFYLNFSRSPGIVTADGDGQHLVGDILKVAGALQENPDKLVLGVRKLNRGIPFRSLFGNVLTRFFFSLLIGKRVSDTQSGLRGLPRSLVTHLLKTRGERYEYEINMLILTKVKGVDILEEKIDTIYIENNRASHFNPLFDSMRIYFQLLRFAFSSLLAAFFDFAIFTTVFKLTSNILLSMLVGRFIVGSMLNYIINKRLVFRSKAGIFSSLFKYYLALLLLSFLSWLLIKMVVIQMGVRVISSKILVESLLFMLSFCIQREFVFVERGESE